MAAIPAKRLLVYVIAGLVVLAVGTGAVVSMRGGAAEGSAVVISGTADGVGSPGHAAAAVGGGSAPLSVVGGPGSSTTTNLPTIYVQVAGAVSRPGVYEMPPDSRVFQAVKRAGGFAADADQQALTLAARLTDGCRVYVPRVGEVPVEADAALVEPTGESGTGEASLVSINSASVEELDSLPGIGPAIARDIVTYRDSNGPFTSIDQLGDVPGIGPSRLDRLRPLVRL